MSTPSLSITGRAPPPMPVPTISDHGSRGMNGRRMFLAAGLGATRRRRQIRGSDGGWMHPLLGQQLSRQPQHSAELRQPQHRSAGCLHRTRRCPRPPRGPRNGVRRIPASSRACASAAAPCKGRRMPKRAWRSGEGCSEAGQPRAAHLQSRLCQRSQTVAASGALSGALRWRASGRSVLGGLTALNTIEPTSVAKCNHVRLTLRQQHAG